MSLAAELVLAQLGIDGILSREPIVVKPTVIDHVDSTAKDLENRAVRFVNANEWTRYVYSKPKWTYRDVLETLDSPATELHFAQAEGLPDSLRVPFQMAATNVVNVLKREIPRQSTTKAFGVELLMPSDSMWAKFCRLLRLANDPGAILTLMSAGTLLPQESQGLREMYPEIFKLIGGAILDRVIELRADKPEWKMDWKRELICARYANTPGFDQQLAKQLQDTFAQKTDTPPAKSSARASKSAEAMKTQTQRTEQA